MKKGFLFLIGFVVLASMSGVLASSNTNSTASAEVTVGGFISLSINPGTILFGNMNASEINKSAINNPLVITIGPETNVAFVNITTRTNNTLFTSASNNFSVTYMEWDTNVSFPLPKNYLAVERSVYLTSSYGQNYSMYHRLTIPSGQTAGSYTVGVVITAKDF
jgi:hypothetical protein